MAIITLPNLNRWSTARWGISTNDTAQETMNGIEQIVQGPPPKRVYQITLMGLNKTERRLWGLALEQMTSLGNIFIAPPPDFEGPASDYSGPNPLVFGSSQLGSSVNVDGASNSTEILKAGDYFTINKEVKRSTADVTTSGTGTATIPFTPAFRTAPLDNEPVVIDAPKVELRFVQPSIIMDLDSVLYGSVSINATEAWR